MAYVDYQYYKNNYLESTTPTIDASTFLILEKEAELELNFKTRGQYLNVTDTTAIKKVKNCLCALVESLNKEQNATSESGAYKQSESVGGHSVSYAGVSPTLYASDRDKIIRLYLWDLGIAMSRKVIGLNEG